MMRKIRTVNRCDLQSIWKLLVLSAHCLHDCMPMFVVPSPIAFVQDEVFIGGNSEPDALFDLLLKLPRCPTCVSAVPPARTQEKVIDCWKRYCNWGDCMADPVCLAKAHLGQVVAIMIGFHGSQKPFTNDNTPWWPKKRHGLLRWSPGPWSQAFGQHCRFRLTIVPCDWNNNHTVKYHWWASLPKIPFETDLALEFADSESIVQALTIFKWYGR